MQEIQRENRIEISFEEEIIYKGRVAMLNTATLENQII